MDIHEIANHVQEATGVNPLQRSRKPTIIRARTLLYLKAIENGYWPRRIQREIGFDHATVYYALNRAHQVLHNPKLDPHLHSVLTTL